MKNSILRFWGVALVFSMILVLVACNGRRDGDEANEKSADKSKNVIVDYVKKPIDKAHEAQRSIEKRQEDIDDESSEAGEENGEDDSEQ